MPIDNPTDLVDEFKKSGEFERLRRELLAQFQQSAGIAEFKSGIADIARQRYESDQKLRFLHQDVAKRELLQEMDRFPIVERAATGIQTLSDPAFSTNIRKSVHNVLLKSKGQKPLPTNVTQSEKTRTLPVKPAANQSPKAANNVQSPAAVPEPSIVITPADESPNPLQSIPPPIQNIGASQTHTTKLTLEKPKAGNPAV